MDMNGSSHNENLVAKPWPLPGYGQLKASGYFYVMNNVQKGAFLQ